MTEIEVYSILKNNNNVQDHGEHEWDNSWLGCSIEDMTEELNKNNFTLIGWFNLSQIKKYTESINLDIGIVCEDEDGERFWCHYAKKWLDNNIEDYERSKKVE